MTVATRRARTPIAPRRPIMRYMGGKWRLAPWIISHFPPHHTYVEPYAGAGSVLMRKFRSHFEVLNDLDEDIVTAFRVLRDPTTAAQLARLLELTPWSRIEFAHAYRGTDDPVERARRVIVRAFMGFGATGSRPRRTGFRAKCHKSSQTGPADWLNYPPHIATFTDRLRGVVLECKPALDIIRQQDEPETLFYVDPPYPHSTRSSIRWPSDLQRSYRHEMSDDDHRALAGVLRSARGMVILSGYACPLYDRELYPDWTRLQRRATVDGGRRRTESLWLSPACSAAMPRLS